MKYDIVTVTFKVIQGQKSNFQKHLDFAFYFVTWSPETKGHGAK